MPVTLDGLRLIALELGPEHTVYSLYAGYVDVPALTVVASTFDTSGREIRRWSFGSDAANRCEGFCYLVPAARGFTLEGAGTVPYVDADAIEIDGPARPLDPVFGADWGLPGDDHRRRWSSTARSGSRIPAP